ncbi:hypothetical protein [Candidatus Palauibacter sp.]|uniref:hypothetical protein n=1 Tax=Candidatus Palauibacter sp. TaxID=3101350 RepID=UPI003AF317F3
MLKNRMDDADRFAKFLRREAAGYHAPPDAPADAMWTEIEIRLAGDALQVGGTASRAVDSAEEPFEALGYHEPPPAPREAMWEAIEAEWARQRPVVSEAREATHGPVRLTAARRLGRRPRRAVVWLTGAAAASVVLAVALGRGGRLPVPAGTNMVATAAPESVAATDSGPIASAVAGETLVPSLIEEPLETSREFAVATPPAAPDPAVPPGGSEADPPVREAVASPPQRPTSLSPSRAQADESDTFRHLNRAADLLVMFRTDPGGAESQSDLARWARETLVETRSLLNTPVAEGERERALLQDLELVLVQIARLGPEAPDFERELARESMEQQGMLMRLRSASGT